MTIDLPAAFGLPPATAFALLHRPGTHGEQVEILAGEPVTAVGIAALPLPGEGGELLAVVPYRQIADRGLACVDDGEPLVAIRVLAKVIVPVAEVLRLLPDSLSELREDGFDVPDDDYAALVERIRDGHIARGDGSNFVLRRSFRAAFARWSPADALAVFARLLRAERGAYWTFVVHWPGRTLAGATPECHVRVADATATMNPISGTYRYPRGGPEIDGLLRFLDDHKEAGELLMVVDEELKTMARICTGGARVHGPRLRAMSRLAHSEYVIDGPTGLDVREVLYRTLPAPAVTGSPVASACRVIAGHEGRGRGYYSGALALIGPDTLDSALIIRTADIDARGRVRIAVGATLVRDSDPCTEAAETHAKAAALLAGLRGVPVAAAAPAAAFADARIETALQARNQGLSTFWRAARAPAAPTGRTLLLVDADDDFTAMLARMAESLGLRVRIRHWDEDLGGPADLTLLGPGPGDPRDCRDPRIARLRQLAGELLATRRPLLAVCLGHQVLAAVLGLPITRLAEPQQGVRRTVTWRGRGERVGFYNSYVALSATDVLHSRRTPQPVRVLRDSGTGAVHALSGPALYSTQFHLESLLTENGPVLLQEMVISTLDDRRVAEMCGPKVD